LNIIFVPLFTVTALPVHNDVNCNKPSVGHVTEQIPQKRSNDVIAVLRKPHLANLCIISISNRPTKETEGQRGDGKLGKKDK
jgi:hypothetical protein